MCLQRQRCFEKEENAVPADFYILDKTGNEREIVKARCLINFNRSRKQK